MELRRDPDTAHIPVVVLSADATEESRRSLLALGANDYLSKPFGMDALLAAMEEALVNRFAC